MVRKAKDHHDNPKLVLKGWKNNETNKFYLIYFDEKSKKLRIDLTNEGNGIFKKKGFHSSVVDKSFIQPFETAFSNLLPRLNYPKTNHFVRIKDNVGTIVNFCIRQLVGGQNFKAATKRLHDEFRDDTWNIFCRYKVPSLNDILKFYILAPTYTKKLEYENVISYKYEELVNRLSSMKCWGIPIDPKSGEFITGAQPYFFKIEGEKFEDLECIKRAYFVITPNFSIAFSDDGYGFGNGNLISFDIRKAREIVLQHNMEILRKSHYIISKELPFVGYELNPKLKQSVDDYLRNREIK